MWRPRRSESFMRSLAKHRGRLSEWFMEAVSKAVGRRPAGSNPAPSATDCYATYPRMQNRRIGDQSLYRGVPHSHGNEAPVVGRSLLYLVV